MIEKYLEYLEKTKYSFESGKTSMPFRASGIGLCERKNVYSALGFEKQSRGNIEGDFTLKVGTAVHEIIQDGLMKAGAIRNMRDANGLPDEVQIMSERYRLSGHVDGVYDLPDGSIGVFEFKTCNNLAFGAIKGKLRKPKKAHLEQCNLYAGFLGAKELTILYYNKNGVVQESDQNIFRSKEWSEHFAEFIVPFSEELFNSSLEKLDRLAGFLDNYKETNKLPPKIYDKQCNYCDFWHICKG